MAPLPEERVKPTPAFHNTSVDIFGPFTIKGEVNKRIKSKAFGVIFTCMSTRGVYCDLSQNYSTDAFMLVLRRFICIRGYPSKIFSDRGTQLVAASTELKELDLTAIQQFGRDQGLEWVFCSPQAPWQNGTAEALIKSVKRAITTSVGLQIRTLSELQTVLLESANLVNERPIGTHPKSPEDGTYLCPNDLLLGRATSRAPGGPFREYSNLKQRFSFIQSLIDAFWKKWTRDYFPSLIIRQKWHTFKRNLRLNDIVLFQEANQIRCSWKLGRVSEVYPGKDGNVRNVGIKHKLNIDSPGFTTIRRAVQRLVVILPVEEQ